VDTIEGIPGFPVRLRLDRRYLNEHFLPIFTIYAKIRAELAEFEKFVLTYWENHNDPPPPPKIFIQYPVPSTQLDTIEVPITPEIEEDTEPLRRRIEEKQAKLRQAGVTIASIAAQHQKLTQEKADRQVALKQEQDDAVADLTRSDEFVGGLSDDLLHTCSRMANARKFFTSENFDIPRALFLDAIKEGQPFLIPLTQHRERLDDLFGKHPPHG
jgi:hypothetical protein